MSGAADLGYDIIGAVKVRDGLFIGDEIAANDLEFVAANKVTRIINCSGRQVGNRWEHEIGIVYLTYYWVDADRQTILDTRDIVATEIYRFIEEVVAGGESILIHSVRGQSRACCVASAYLMKRYSWGLGKTLEFLKSRRPDVRLKQAFIRQLEDYERRLVAQSASSFTYDWVQACFTCLECDELLLRNTYINSQHGEVADYKLTIPTQWKFLKLKWTDNNIGDKLKLEFGCLPDRNPNRHRPSILKLHLRKQDDANLEEQSLASLASRPTTASDDCFTAITSEDVGRTKSQQASTATTKPSQALPFSNQPGTTGTSGRTSPRARSPLPAKNTSSRVQSPPRRPYSRSPEPGRFPSPTVVDRRKAAATVQKQPDTTRFPSPTPERRRSPPGSSPPRRSALPQTGPSSAERRPSPAERRPSPAERRPSLAERRPSPAARRPAQAEKRSVTAEKSLAPPDGGPSPADRRPPPAERCSSPRERRPSAPERRPSPAKRQPSPTERRPPVTDKRLTSGTVSGRSGSPTSVRGGSPVRGGGVQPGLVKNKSDASNETPARTRPPTSVTSSRFPSPPRTPQRTNRISRAGSPHARSPSPSSNAPQTHASAPSGPPAGLRPKVVSLSSHMRRGHSPTPDFNKSTSPSRPRWRE